MQGKTYWIRNQILQAGVSTMGAEVIHVGSSQAETNMIWCGDADYFSGHSPVLFPYTGRLTGDRLVVDGREYKGSYHGFAKNMMHSVVCAQDNYLSMELRENEETLKLWPYRFALQSSFSLEDATLKHVVTVKNTDEKEMRFGLGFHPAFGVPFDEKHTPDDYVISFDRMESPLCIDTSAEGLQSGKVYYLGRNVTEVPVTEELFLNGSHCMANLQSKKVSLKEKDSDRSIEVDVSDFPYTLLWSSAKSPVRFVCIEPWKSLPGEAGIESDWNLKPAAAVLRPGESYSASLVTTYNICV